MRGIFAWLVVLSLTVVVGGGCDLKKSRFASCETDEHCKGEDETKPYCWNLRCVSCANDRHCKDGQFCDSKDHNCSSL